MRLIDADALMKAIKSFRWLGVPNTLKLMFDYLKIIIIEVFTDPGDIVIDPCCGSGSTIQAAFELGRDAYGFEVNRKFYEAARSQMPCFREDPRVNLFEEVSI